MKCPTCLAGFAIAMLLLFTSNNSHAQLLKRLKQTVKDHIENRTDQRTGEATDKAMDKTEDAVKGNNSGNSNSDAGSSSSSSSGGDMMASSSGKNNVPTIKSYENYDFVPGDTVLFADDFTEDQEGEFPSHWNLTDGQAVVNKVTGTPAFYLTEGNYCRVYPNMKTKAYLTDPFTLEFDYFPNGSAYGPVVFLNYIQDGRKEEAQVQFTEKGGVETSYFPHNFSNDYPSENNDTYFNRWHHCAMIYKNNQLKCYVDQYRVLVMPNAEIVPNSFGFGGIGDAKNPIIITNVRVAAGGNMNMIGKKFTEAKIVTHGINFDIDKATIKPESMGTLNMIVNVLKNNPDLKFEIDGHTDNTGEAAHNLALSQDRADAVKAQLIKMGINGSRLTTKGFGDTKPIDTNSTPAGKANNRRVEFVKM